MLFSLSQMMPRENTAAPHLVPVAVRNFSRNGCGTIVEFRATAEQRRMTRFSGATTDN
jgi:hypothetical protein